MTCAGWPATHNLLRGKNEWIRAFLSSDYVAYNNGHVTETVHEPLTNAAVSVRSFVLEETGV